MTIKPLERINTYNYVKHKYETVSNMGKLDEAYKENTKTISKRLSKLLKPYVSNLYASVSADGRGTAHVGYIKNYNIAIEINDKTWGLRRESLYELLSDMYTLLSQAAFKLSKFTYKHSQLVVEILPNSPK